MKFITALALFVTVVAGNALPGVELGHFVQRSAFPIQPASTPEEICEGFNGFRCGDCEKMLLCLGSAPPVTTACPSDKPYCDASNDVCVSSPPADGSCGDSLSDPSFTCTQANSFFPHPTNCSLFYECVNSVAYLLECNPNQVWSTVGMACKTKKVSADCGTFNCNLKANYEKIMPYTANNAYFAYCKTPVNGKQDIVVMKCERVNEYYNTATKLCEFQCKDTKLYEDALDIHSYYDCSKVGTKFVSEHKTCTLGRVFNEATQSCV
ncbi:uncharacterized protein LOC129787462 [Lutzomyia longipalpis]|nr:uncharacterized protein LOC129787462 [Lutzomyia longipalpis]